MADYIIYSYFNSAEIQALLNAVVMLVGSTGPDGDFLSLIRIAGMIGLMIAIVAGIARARGEDAGMYVVMMALFYSILFTPRVTVTIEDATGSGGAPVNVANVPLGLAFFASATSKIGYWFTENTETFFTLPDNELKFSKHGLMGATRALREASGAAVANPVLAQDLVNFMRDCINPELISAPATMTALLQSTSIWADLDTLGLINPGRIVTLASQAVPLDCRTAYDPPNLTTSVSAETTTLLGEIARKISPYAPPAVAVTIINSMLPAAEGLSMTASATAGDAVRQRMMINMLNDTGKTIAEITGDTTAAQNAMATAMAAKSANSAYLVMSKLAADTLPMIRNAIELVVIGVFPIVLVLIIIAGSKGGMVLRSYVLTMFWVQLWAPLYAIVNYVGTLAAAKQLSSVLSGLTNVAVLNSAAFTNTAISAEAVTGLLTISVPMIALAIVKGGEVAMSGVVSSMLGPAQNSASSTGASAGLGSYSYANTQWGTHSDNNVSSNKIDSSFSHVSPSLSKMTDGGGTWTGQSLPDGSQRLVGHTPHGMSPQLGMSLGGNVGLGNTDSSGRRVSGGTDTSAGFQSAMRAMLGNSQVASDMRRLDNALKKDGGFTDGLSGLLKAGSDAAGSSNGQVSDTNRNTNRVVGQTVVGGNVEAGGAVRGDNSSSSGVTQSRVLNQTPEANVPANNPSMPSLAPQSQSGQPKTMEPVGKPIQGAQVQPMQTTNQAQAGGQVQAASVPSSQPPMPSLAPQPQTGQQKQSEAVGKPVENAKVQPMQPGGQVPSNNPSMPSLKPGETAAPEGKTRETKSASENSHKSKSLGAKASASANLAFQNANESSDGSQSSQTGEYSHRRGEAYDRAMKIFGKWESGLTDTQSKQAAKELRSALEQSSQSTYESKTGVSDQQFAGNENRYGRQNTIQSAIKVGSLAELEYATALHGGNREAAGYALNTGDFATGVALQQYRSGNIDSPAYKEFLLSNGLQMPKSADQTKIDLNADVNAARTTNDSAVKNDSAKFDAEVKAKQHADPTKGPDKSQYNELLGAMTTQLAAGLSDNDRKASMEAGIKAIAPDIYNRLNEPGFSTFLKNFNHVDGFNSTKTTTADVTRILTHIAESSPSVQSAFVAAGQQASKGAISPAMTDYITQLVREEDGKRKDALNGK